MATPTATPDRSSPAAINAEPLQQGLAPLARRMRLLRAVRYGARGVIAASVASLVLLALSRAGHFPFLLDLSLPIVIPVLFTLGVGAGILPALVQKTDLLALARYAEQQLQMKERLSSALTLGNQGGDLVRLQRADAAHFAARIEPRAVIRWRWTWELPAAILSLMLVLLAAFLPASPLSVTAPDRVARVETAREGRALEEVARQVLRQSDQAAPPPVKDAARRLQQIARAMQSRHATKAQAVEDLQQLSDQIKKANKQAAASSAPGLRSSGPDKSAQARAAAQQELDRALNTDSKGAGTQSADAPRTPAQSNASGKGNTQGSSSGTGASPSQTGGTGTDTPLGHDARGSAGAKTGNTSSGGGKSGSTGAQKQPGGQANAPHGQGGAQPGKNGTNKPGTSSSQPRSQTQSSSPQKSTSAQPSASQTSTPPGSKPNPGSQTQDAKKSGTPSRGKEYGKSAPAQPTTQQAASNGELLGDKLRRYADKIAQRPMATGEREQAAGSLDQLNQKLNDAKMPETRKHIQAAAQALREGRQQDAVSELRQAAEAADRETPVTERQTNQTQSSSSSSSSSGSQGGSQNGASQQMQRAVDRSKQTLSGQGKPGPSGSGKPEQGQPGQGQPGQQHSGQPGSGTPGNNEGAGSGPPPDQPRNLGDTAHVHGGGVGAGGDRKRPNPPASAALSASGLGKVVLRPIGPGGRMIEKPVPGREMPGAASSTVPYYKILPQFKKAAEKDAGAENIPPAYRQQVKKYFDSLTPGHKGP